MAQLNHDLTESQMRGSRWSARRVMSCVLVLVAVVFCGCGGTAGVTTSAKGSGSSAERQVAARRVSLHLNSGSYSLSESSRRVSGTVSLGASVRVNGHAAHVKAGRWSRTVGLRIGDNSIQVVATMTGLLPSNAVIHIVRHHSPAELEAKARARALRAEARKRQEAEARERRERKQQGQLAEQQHQQALSECTNGTYVNAAGNTVCKPVESSTQPAGATAECEDGTYSFSESRSGTCSHHGGVRTWLNE
jgi:hypothetical protein